MRKTHEMVRILMPVEGRMWIEVGGSRTVVIVEEDPEDATIRLVRNGKLILKVPSGERPWFFRPDQLSESIKRRGADAVAIDVLRWFARPVDGIVREIETVEPRVFYRKLRLVLRQMGARLKVIE